MKCIKNTIMIIYFTKIILNNAQVGIDKIYSLF